jgi:hypothetical protein
MQFVYQGLSYHLDAGAVMKDLELIYLKALQGDEYHSLTDEQKLLLEVAWNYFASNFLAHDFLTKEMSKGEQLFHMIQVGYVERIAFNPEQGELAVELSLPSVVS